MHRFHRLLVDVHENGRFTFRLAFAIHPNPAHSIHPSTMLDLIYLLAAVGFFFGSIAYAHWCGKI